MSETLMLRSTIRKNPAPNERSRVLEMIMGCELLHTFFAQASAFGGTLARFELRVTLTDDVEGALTLDDLAVFVALFHGEK